MSGVKASITFDPNDLANSSISASVPVKTIKTGIEKRDEHLKAAEYFNAASYPTIKLASTAFTSKGGNKYSGAFRVTIKGKTKTINMPFTFSETGTSGVFKGTLKLDRLDFGVGESSWVLGDDVTVNITLNATKK